MDVAMRAALMQLPIRTRVAIALGSAERVLHLLPGAETQRLKMISRQALHEAWEWTGGKETSARSIYDQIYPLTLCIEEYDLQGSEKSALAAIVYALYYAAWHATIQEQCANSKARLLPNDINEVSEETLVECMDHVAQAVRNEVAWQEQVVRRMESECMGVSAAELGRPQRPEDIGITEGH